MVPSGGLQTPPPAAPEPSQPVHAHQTAALQSAARAMWAESLYPNEPRVEPRVRVSRFATLLRRGRVAGMLASVGIWLIVAAYIVLTPPRYESRAVMLVDTDRLAEITSRYGTDESWIGAFGGGKVANQAEIIRIAPVIAETTAARLLSSLSARELALLPDYGSDERAPAYLALWLQKDVVTVTSQSDDDRPDAIEISASAPSPELAARIADTYVNTYVDLIRSGVQQQRERAATFQQDRVTEYEAELSDIDERLRAFWEENGTLTASAEAEIASRHVSELRSGLDDANIALSTHQATLESLESELAAIDPDALSAQIAASADAEIAGLQSRIADLDFQIARYYTRTPSLRDDPSPSSDLVKLLADVAQQRERLSELSKQLVSAVMESGGLDLSKDDTGRAYLMRLRQGMAEERVAVRSARARRDAIQRRLSAFEQSKRKFSEQSIPLAQLERAKELSETKYSTAMEALTELQLFEPGDFVQIIASAEAPKQPSGPKPLLLAIFGLIVGLMVGGGVAYGRSVFDGRVHDSDELESEGLPVDGVLPELGPFVSKHFRGSSHVFVAGRNVKTEVITVTGARSPEAALFRKFATRLLSTSPRGSVLLFTSAESGAGKSVTAANTAAGLALAGHRTLLVDADTYRLSQRNLLGLSDRCLFDVEAGGFYGNGGPEMREGALRLLYTIGLYSARPVATEHLAVHQLDRLIQFYRQYFDFIVVDTPPVMATSFTQAVGRLADRRILVTASGSTRLDLLRQARQEMAAAGAPATGFVLTRFNTAASSAYRSAYDEIRGYASTTGPI